MDFELAVKGATLQLIIIDRIQRTVSQEWVAGSGLPKMTWQELMLNVYIWGR